MFKSGSSHGIGAYRSKNEISIDYTLGNNQKKV